MRWEEVEGCRRKGGGSEMVDRNGGGRGKQRMTKNKRKEDEED